MIKLGIKHKIVALIHSLMDLQLPDKDPLLHWASPVCTGAPQSSHSGISVSLECPTLSLPPQRWSLHQSSAEEHVRGKARVPHVKCKRRFLPVLTLSMALPTFDTLPWMSLCRDASICTVSLIFLQHCAIVWDRIDKSASCTPASENKEVSALCMSSITSAISATTQNWNNFLQIKNIKTTTTIRLKLQICSFQSAYVHKFFLPKATSCPRISQTLRRSSSSLSSDWWPYITKRWSTFSSSLSTHAHCSMV